MSLYLSLVSNALNCIWHAEDHRDVRSHKKLLQFTTPHCQPKNRILLPIFRPFDCRQTFNQSRSNPRQFPLVDASADGSNSPFEDIRLMSLSRWETSCPRGSKDNTLLHLQKFRRRGRTAPQYPQEFEYDRREGHSLACLLGGKELPGVWMSLSGSIPVGKGKLRK